MTRKASLEEVKATVRKACYNLTGESLEELLANLGWTPQEYKIALVEQAGQISTRDMD